MLNNNLVLTWLVISEVCIEHQYKCVSLQSSSEKEETAHWISQPFFVGLVAGSPVLWSDWPVLWSDWPAVWSSWKAVWSGQLVVWNGRPVAWSGSPVKWLADSVKWPSKRCEVAGWPCEEAGRLCKVASSGCVKWPASRVKWPADWTYIAQWTASYTQHFQQVSYIYKGWKFWSLIIMGNIYCGNPCIL